MMHDDNDVGGCFFLLMIMMMMIMTVIISIVLFHILNRLKRRQLETINILLRMNPETAALADANDMLPLHLSVYYNCSLEVVQAIYNGKLE